MKRKIDSFEERDEVKQKHSLDATIAKIQEYERLNLFPVNLDNEQKKRMDELNRQANIIIARKEIEWANDPIESVRDSYIEQGQVTNAHCVFDGKDNYLLITYVNDQNLQVNGKFLTNEKSIWKIKVGEYHIFFTEGVSDNNYPEGTTRIRDIVIVK